MIKRISDISALAITTLLSLPTIALVNNPSYVSVQAGGAFSHSKLTHETDTVGLLKKKPKAAGVFDIYAGTKLFTNTYAELEFAYAKHKFRNNFLDSNVAGTLRPNSFSTKLQTVSGFANLSYRFQDLSTIFIPYIVGGVGCSSNKVENMTLFTPASSTSPELLSIVKSKSKTQAAWQIGAGVLVPVTKSVSINLSYKYRDLGKIKATNVFTNADGSTALSDSPALAGKIRTSNVLLGVNIDF
jgi:opacity protein-like surface antigen